MSYSNTDDDQLTPVRKLAKYAYCPRLAYLDMGPYQGFFHQSPYGRPSLALDLIALRTQDRVEVVVVHKAEPTDSKLSGTVKSED